MVMPRDLFSHNYVSVVNSRVSEVSNRVVALGWLYE